ncbi:hypothetical protein D915_010414 [Fasciola hepatica]|uniref:Uncharacterized protein n=1 Tax=Fasciola hepatica TaxID=6192 RepID=A0A4E0QV43_FASHE|nr:hypothetical protein D915_010414 [Fasciola hepatica]
MPEIAVTDILWNIVRTLTESTIFVVKKDTNNCAVTNTNQHTPDTIKGTPKFRSYQMSSTQNPLFEVEFSEFVVSHQSILRCKVFMIYRTLVRLSFVK